MLSKDKIGLKYPVQLDGKGDLATATGLDLEKGDITFLLSIEKGEVPWDHNYGTRIRELLHDHVASKVTARAIAFRECTDQINTYAPVYRVKSTDVLFSSNLARVSVTYVERGKLEAESKQVTFEVNR